MEVVGDDFPIFHGYDSLRSCSESRLTAWLRGEASIAVEERPRFVALLTVKERVGFGKIVFNVRLRV